MRNKPEFQAFFAFNKRLEDIIPDKKTVARWWDRPNPSFDGKTARKQLIEDPKEIENMLFRLESGMLG